MFSVTAANASDTLLDIILHSIAVLIHVHSFRDSQQVRNTGTLKQRELVSASVSVCSFAALSVEYYAEAWDILC